MAFNLISFSRTLLLTGIWGGAALSVSASPMESVRDGDIARGIAELAAIPDTDTRGGMAFLALDVLPKEAEITPMQITALMRCLNGPLSVQHEKKLADRLRGTMVTMIDSEMLSAFESGVGVYGGNTLPGCQRAYDFFGRADLLEMQAPFLPDWKTAVKGRQWGEIRQPLEFLFKRSVASGRAANREDLWRCLEPVLTDTSVPRDLLRRGETMFLTLLPQLPDTQTDSVLNHFFADPAAASRCANTYYTQLSQKLSQAGNGALPPDEWIAECHSLDRLVERVAAIPQVNTAWSLNDRKMFVRRCGQLWMDTCRKQISAHQDRQRRMRQRYGRETEVGGFELTAEGADLLISTVPKGKYAEMLAQMGMAQTLEDVQTDLYIIADRYAEVADRIVSAVKAGTSTARAAQLANALLDKMMQGMNPNYNQGTNQQMLKSVTSMTRLRSKSNVAQFRAVLEKLRTIEVEPSVEKRLAVFEAIHSKAEIYQESDLHFTFGSPAEMDESALFKVATHISKKLSGEWQDNKTQLAFMTRRTPKETELLALEGYTMLDSMLSAAQNGVAGRKFLAHALRGSVLYQCAEYLRKQKAPEAEIEQKRTLGLQCFQRAAERYNALVSELYEPQYSTVIYELWFDATMLAGAGKYNVKDRPNILAIREMILRMPPDVAQKHLNQLAVKLAEGVQRQNARVRPIYLLSALKVIEGTRVADAFKRRLAYYRSLIDEAKLIVEPDMENGRVSSDAIGLRLSLRHTPELSRESGGFARYLSFASNPNNFIINSMMGMGGDEGESIANRDNLEKTFTESLVDHFEILSIAFCDVKASPVLLPDGWIFQPLAYLLVKPKADTLDRIPEIKMELEFADDNKLVVLPVESAPVAIRLMPPADQPIPQAVKVTQRANFRDLTKGRVTLEVNAHAAGLIGGFETLFEAPIFEGFTMSDSEDGGSQINEVSADSAGMNVTFERTWVFHLKPVDPEKLPLKLFFPAPKSHVSVNNLATHDVNYVPCDGFCLVRETHGTLESISAAAFLGVPLSTLLYSGIGFLVLVLVGVAIFRLRSRRQIIASIGMPLPENAGPFAVLRYLRAIESGAVLSEADRAALTADIAAIESAWFVAAPIAEKPDIAAILSRWKGRAAMTLPNPS